MRTLVCNTPHDFEMKDTARPVRGGGEALLRVRGIGVCGTDYHAFRGKQPFFEYPRVLGHEIVAEIEDIAEDTPGFAKGDLVTVLPYISCGQCIACRNQRFNACEKLQVIGVHLDGAMREFLCVDVAQLVSAKGLTSDQAVVVEPLAISLHGVNRAEVRRDEWVLVLGAGPIGLGCMRFAKLAGARVIAADVNPTRLGFARSWAGVDEVVDARGDLPDQLRRATGGDLPLKAIDCTGSAEAMKGAFALAAAGGIVVYVSLVLSDISFHDPDFHKKELVLKGSRAATKTEFAEVIQCLRDGRVDASAFISHRAAFAQVLEAFPAWIKPESGVIKAVIEF